MTFKIKNEINKKENYAVNIDQEIRSIKKQVRNETDPAHIIFLNDHLGYLNYELDTTNVELYLLRQKLKNLELEENFKQSNKKRSSRMLYKHLF